ncbi:hypothetical protein E1B28_000765 [Marasmius oreades]|uniref:Uncharacterized protein n=1 Tax=Marasmius oreades TaxID=181124 RepID=A0A9P8AEP4_9AGAR|nr:uncharacterized protein E1B28_000765 [Marasmius oreades]KAG7098862.1 hypothetical protein E1B28_000765 [Marasmius oreades]
MPILIATAGRPPLYHTPEWNCAVAHRLLGHDLATYLKIPEPLWSMRIRVWAVLVSEAIPVHFGRLYGRIIRYGWLEKRRSVYAIVMPMVLRTNLGMRRTKFRPGGDVSPLRWEDESIVPDRDGARKARKMFREVILEMVCVLLAVSALTNNIQEAQVASIQYFKEDSAFPNICDFRLTDEFTEPRATFPPHSHVQRDEGTRRITKETFMQLDYLAMYQVSQI